MRAKIVRYNEEGGDVSRRRITLSGLGFTSPETQVLVGFRYDDNTDFSDADVVVELVHGAKHIKAHEVTVPKALDVRPLFDGVAFDLATFARRHDNVMDLMNALLSQRLTDMVHVRFVLNPPDVRFDYDVVYVAVSLGEKNAHFRVVPFAQLSDFFFKTGT